MYIIKKEMINRNCNKYKKQTLKLNSKKAKRKIKPQKI